MKNKTISTLISVAALTAVTNLAWALGTAADTDIDNTASISYSVGGVTQTPIESSEAGNTTPGAGEGTATTFKVDKKIDLLVTGANTTNVAPGQTGAANDTELTFTLKNEGNSTENFSLTPAQVASGGSDTFDTSNCSVTTPAALPVTLTADQEITVKVECDIPASSAVVTNGASSLVDLLAEADGAAAQAAADSGADNPLTVQTVLADDTGTTTDGANSNAKHSATSTYKIATANLSVAKTSAVTNDPINGATNPKRIPGATIEYTITVTNAVGGTDATNLVISDALPADLSFVSCATSADVAGVTCAHAAPNITTSAFTLPAGTTETLTIIATVK